MAGYTFTTELVNEDLTLGLYDPRGIFAVPVKRVAEKQGMAVISLNTSIGAELHQKVAKCYKVIIAVTPASCTDSVIATLTQLKEYQEKIVVWLPVVTVWEEQVVGEVPHAAQFFALQESVIDHLNVTLSQAVLLLGKDVILPPGYGGTLDLLFQKIPDHLVYTPSLEFTPVGLAEFVIKALAQSIKPDRISSQIMGQMIRGTAVVESIAHSYEQYYFHQLAKQPVSGYVQPLVSFPLQKIVVPSSASEALKWYSRQLPSPDNWHGILPSITYHPLYTAHREENSFYQEVSYSAPLLTTIGPAQPQYHRSPAVSVQSMPAIVPSPVTASVQMQPAEVSAATAAEDSGHSPKKSLEGPSHSVISDRVVSQEEFDVQDEIHRIFGNTRSKEKIERVSSLVADTKKITKRSKKRTTAFYGGLAFTGAGLGVLFLILVFMLSTNLLRSSLANTVQAVSQGREVQDSQWGRLARTTRFVSAQATGYEAVVSLPQLQSAQQLAALSTALQETVAAVEQLQRAQEAGFERIMGTDTQIEQNSENVLTELATAQEKLAETESYLQQNTIGSEVSDSVTEWFSTKLSEMNSTVQLYQSIAPLWGELSGQTRARTYAIIFQNNQELRPTGGIVEAFAVVTLSGGTVTGYEVFSSYEVKSKTPGQVTAPPEITQYLGEEQLYLYDANWEPDFAQASQRMQYFIEHASGTSLDGMISLDAYAMQQLLEVTGPLELPEFNEVITAENLFERLEAHPEVVLVPDGKNKDYRVVLLSHLISAVQNLPSEKSPALLAALQTNFSGQAQQWYSLHPEEQTTFQNLGWTGTVLYPKCPPELGTGQCIADFVYQVEANVGVNKANYYLERSQEDIVSIAAGQITHTVSTTLKNTARTSSWPKGPYKSFTRWYIPEQATAISVEIDGSVVPADQLKTARAYEKQVVGAYIEVPVSQTTDVVLSYTIPFSADGSKQSYAYLRQRQPGSGTTAASVSIEYSDNYSPLLIAPDATTTDGKIKFSEGALETSLFAVQFTSSK